MVGLRLYCSILTIDSVIVEHSILQPSQTNKYTTTKKLTKICVQEIAFQHKLSTSTIICREKYSYTSRTLN